MNSGLAAVETTPVRAVSTPGDPRGPALAWVSCLALLAAVGLLTAGSAAPPGEAGLALGLHSAHLALGLGAFLGAFLLDPEHARRWVRPALLVVWVLLVAMLAGIGHSSHEATRWIRIGGFSLQPSLLYQCLWPVALASWVVRDPLRLRQPRALMMLGGGFFLLMLPVFLQPDLGSVAILMLVSGITLLFAGAPMGFLWSVLGVGGGALLAGFLLFPHVADRLDWWKQPEEQVLRGMEAISAPGLAGRGPGLGVMKYGHVPESRTDFVMTVIGEEWGLIGSVTVWSLYAAFTLFGFAIARRAATRYGIILIAAATTMVSIQAAYNMAMITGLVPVKGLPLPFVSRGGSSILALSALLGFALRAAFQSRRAPAPAATLLP
ncbi:MAG: FtsW/RodA/SpoVE family cell cycle protein [Planctomycetota bacterium]|nr:FtsW/RodA/SpoVE family cell cycle protein [Planctomycetota bacterium]